MYWQHGSCSCFRARASARAGPEQEGTAQLTLCPSAITSPFIAPAPAAPAHRPKAQKQSCAIYFCQQRPTYALPLCHHQCLAQAAHRAPPLAKNSGALRHLYFCQQRHCPSTFVLPLCHHQPLEHPWLRQLRAKAEAPALVQLWSKAQVRLRQLLLPTAPNLRSTPEGSEPSTFVNSTQFKLCHSAITSPFIAPLPSPPSCKQCPTYAISF